MNETECENLIKSVKWTEPASLISLAILEFINVLVIGGNCLVIAAVFCSNKLRSVTNLFIVNLAVADLLVGLAVLPFSATWEVFKVWIFGDVWCRIWLAVDVWMCTASILNLCAISLDRYVAVTRPVTYPTIMSMKKAKSLIAGIWVLSFVICFPPLVNWKDQKSVQKTYNRGNYTLYYATSTTNTISSIQSHVQQHIASTLLPAISNIYNSYDSSKAETADATINSINMIVTEVPTDTYEALLLDDEHITSVAYNKSSMVCSWKCELTNDRGYVLYSALGSFYIPMFVMLFFYWRIYRAAVQTTRAINQGFKTTKGSPREPSSRNNRMEDSHLILRIHRGRPCTTQQRTPLSMHSVSSTLSINSNVDENYPLHSNILQVHTPKRSTSMRLTRQRHEKIGIKVSFPSSENMLKENALAPSSPSSYALVTTTYNKLSLSNGRRESFKSSLFEIGETSLNLDTAISSINCDNGCSHVHSYSHNNQRDIKCIPPSSSPCLSLRDSSKKRSGKRSGKIQIKRFRMETKAAKTLAIIVGGFIVCWLPFFTMYLIRAFCEQCIQPTVFSVLFWLGYCNSAINPVIYALFSNEFRIAFKRIVCHCVCTRSGFRASESFQMIAARALMAPATFHKTISGCSDDDGTVDLS